MYTYGKVVIKTTFGFSHIILLSYLISVIIYIVNNDSLYTTKPNDYTCCFSYSH